MREERKKLGYGQIDIPDYVIDGTNTNENDKIKKIIDKADAVIIGSAPESLIKDRLKDNKLVFRYSERPLKNGNSLIKYPHRWYHLRKVVPTGKNVYMLCSSAYTAADFAKFGMYKNRCYKWGYFPECKKYDSVDTLLKNKIKNKILWCGRFLDWKHPEIALDVAKKLKDAGYDFSLDFVGMGQQEDEMHRLVDMYGLQKYVNFLGSMKPEAVRECMEKAGIFLFTSDRKEGWGAVLNESMNSGCAVVASHSIGSVPFLIDDKNNGLIYSCGNSDDLYNKVKLLLDNPEKQETLGRMAYKTITEQWNAETSAKRLVELIECIKRGENKPALFNSGVCSKSEIIKDNWYKGTNVK